MRRAFRQARCRAKACHLINSSKVFRESSRHPNNIYRNNRYEWSFYHKTFFDKFCFDYFFLVDDELRNEVFVHTSEHFIVSGERSGDEKLDEDEMEDQHQTYGQASYHHHFNDEA